MFVSCEGMTVIHYTLTPEIYGENASGLSANYTLAEAVPHATVF